MLCRLAHVRQASFFHGVLLDASPSLDDGLISAEVDVGRREITEALVVPVVVVVGDEGLDLPLQIALQEVVFQQDPVLQGLMPTLGSLGLRGPTGATIPAHYPGSGDGWVRPGHGPCPARPASRRDRRRCKTSRCRLAAGVCG